MVSQDYITGKLNEFVKSDKGKKFLRKKGVCAGVTKEEAKEAAKVLKRMIIDASMGVCKSSKMLLDDYSIKINPVREQKDGRYKITLTVNKDDLARESLLNKSPWNGGEPIGSGVYDIVGLFTQGYKANKYVYGWWDSESKFVRSHSLANGTPGLKPNDFIDKAIAGFKTAFPKYKMEITYPSRWHSK